MRTALIGHTGFVGSTLARQFSFTDHYNSQNISEIVGKTYDFIVCAAAPGVKWKANQDPVTDKASIAVLITNLEQVSAGECILISTVDVYPEIAEVDEATKIDQSQLQPYGLHRLELETAVKKIFPKVTICRLPALFGKGLKKNFVFDLIHQPKMLEFTHPESKFQFYNLANLWSDIQVIRQKNLTLMNFVTEPLQAKTIADAVNTTWTPGQTAKPVNYDLRTKHAVALGKTGHYIAAATEVLPELLKFIQEQRQ